MSEKIKIVYNWIGPRGPIPNTEVPNLLNLASVMEEVQTTSHKFWADNIWHLIFNRPGFELAPAMMINQDDTFIYPFTLTWRIPFTNYLLKDSGITEFAHTPGHILHQVRNGKGFFLIDLSAEAFVEPQQLSFLHSYFSSIHIPMNKVIYLTGCMNAGILYDEWLQTQGLTDSNKMIIESFPISQDSLAIHFEVFNPEIPEYDINRVPEKLFLVWNRRFRQHRTSLAFGLEHLNLIDRSYISMGRTDPENTSVDLMHTYDPTYTSDLQINDNTIQRFVNKLPLILDGETNTVKMCQDFDNACRNFYQNSLVSIITETNFNAREVTLTEKSFKPSKEKHPFVIVGAQGVLKAIQDMGFKTFNEFWDESYDTIADPKQRMNAILRVCEAIGKWDEQQIRNFRSRVKPILEHNYETLKVRYASVVASKIETVIKNRYL